VIEVRAPDAEADGCLLWPQRRLLRDEPGHAFAAAQALDLHGVEQRRTGAEPGQQPATDEPFDRPRLDNHRPVRRIRSSESRSNQAGCVVGADRLR
jgi:hypothetical protein